MNTTRKKRNARFSSHGSNPRRRNSRGRNKRQRKELPIDLMKSLSIQPEQEIDEDKYEVTKTFNDFGIHKP